MGRDTVTSGSGDATESELIFELIFHQSTTPQ